MTANFRRLTSISVAALGLILSLPSTGQTNPVASLADLTSDPAPLPLSDTTFPIELQKIHANIATFASAVSVDSPLSVNPEQQSQREVASSTDSTAQGSTTSDKAPLTQQFAQPTSQPGTSNDRLFDLLPNFLTLEHAADLPPLTPGEKFKVVARGTFDYVQLPWYGFLAGLSQAQNSEPGYGQGAVGYGKRYAAYVADGTIENFMVGAVLPSILHQDPRFYQSGDGGFLHRLSYAASRIVVTRSDSGAAQLNYSEIFGSAISAGISTYSYHPRADRTVPNTVSVWGSQVGYDTVALVIKEFWPDIRRKISHKRSSEVAGL